MSALISRIKEAREDFEWYPTTQEMIDAINLNIKENYITYNRIDVLDCGAGDGRVLKALSRGGDMYAIEKSQVLINNMSPDVFIVGTEFESSILIDKRVDVIFCNPPYLEYEKWAVKVISEANCKDVYLILPQRWRRQKSIGDAIKVRNGDVNTIGSYDFLNAERKARAKVDILHINMKNVWRDACKTDPFDVWFDKTFSIDADKEIRSEWDVERQERDDLKDKMSSMVAGRGVIDVLVELYNEDMKTLQYNFQTVCKLNANILSELNVSVENVKAAIKQRIKGLKCKYWREFFDHYETITSRLTTRSRESMLNKLHSNMSVEFTVSNAYAVTIWAIKNANKYYDTQLIETVENMVTRANILMYKSNKRTWGDEEWRYIQKPKGLQKYALELRVILHNQGGMESTYGGEFRIATRAENFINDVLVVANNLGFNNWSTHRNWEAGKVQKFYFADKELMQVKAFKNGNLHIKFNQAFIRRMNVEFGRLKGWIKDKRQAASELDIPIDEVEFNSNYQLNASNVKLICQKNK